MRLLLPLLLLPACDGLAGKDCTLIGCVSQLVLTVEGPSGTSEVTGTVTVGEQTFAVDCAADSDPAVTCEGATIVLDLLDGTGGGEVTWTLSVDAPDSGGGGGGYVGDGTVTPEWASSTPNGPDCEPTCWTGALTVELLPTP